MSTLTLPVNLGDHQRGSPTALFTLVQYGDYESPECAKAHATVKKIQAFLGDHLRFVYRHFPQTDLHPNALHAAEASEAAANQGRFWEMHDYLLTHQHNLSNGFLAEYASLLDLDLSRFLREMTEDVHLQRVMDDWESGKNSGVKNTPTFFVNGYRYDGKWDMESLLQALSEVEIRK